MLLYVKVDILTQTGGRNEKNVFDHYIAVDWSTKNMAIARMTKRSNKITVMDVPSDVKELQLCLKKLKGSKVFTLEETTTSQWLYTELAGYVNKIIICNPHRNRLLKEYQPYRRYLVKSKQYN